MSEVIRCDGPDCGKYLTREVMEAGVMQNWTRLMKTSSGGDMYALDFCSPVCLANHVSSLL